MKNKFAHLELQTSDLTLAKKFYTTLLEWKASDLAMEGLPGAYTMIDTGDGGGAGMMKNPMPNVPPHWLAYIEVSDVGLTVEKAQKLGARVLQPKTEVPGMGTYAVIQDPTGAAVGFWETAKKA